MSLASFRLLLRMRGVGAKALRSDRAFSNWLHVAEAQSAGEAERAITLDVLASYRDASTSLSMNSWEAIPERCRQVSSCPSPQRIERRRGQSDGDFSLWMRVAVGTESLHRNDAWGIRWS